MRQIDYEKLHFDLLRENARRNLAEFFRQVWNILEPGRQLKWNWHIDVMAEHLTAMKTGEITRLVINIPPGFSKSLLCSAVWPVWLWIDQPELRFLTASYALPLATRDAVRSRNILRSAWYRKRWGPGSDWNNHFRLVGDMDTKSRYENDKRGFRIAVSVGGSAGGERADVKILDDPINIVDAYSDSALLAAKNFVKDVWSTRNTDAMTTRDLVVMQRLNHQDISGYLLSEIGGYEHLVLPMHKTKITHSTKLGEFDRRTEIGELLDPLRFPAEVVETDKMKLGSYGFAAQMQQDPLAEDSGMIKQRFMTFYVTHESKIMDTEFVDIPTESGAYVTCPVEALPAKFDFIIQSWDCSFGVKKTTSSYVAGHVYGVSGERFFLLDRVFKRMTFTETLAAIKRLTSKWPASRYKLIEAKANGPAVINSIKDSISGIVPITPHESKTARMHAALPYIEGGGLILPHPVDAPWVNDFVANIVSFPHGATDDDADSLSQVLNWFIVGPKITIT